MTELQGIISKYNRKTVTVITDTGHQWNVSPHFLRRAESSSAPSTDGASVVRHHQRFSQSRPNDGPKSPGQSSFAPQYLMASPHLRDSACS